MVLDRTYSKTLAWLLVVMIILTATYGLLVSKQEQLRTFITMNSPLDFPEGIDGVKTDVEYCYFNLAYAAMPDTLKDNSQKINLFDECCQFSIPQTDYFSEIKSKINGDFVFKSHIPVLDKVVLIE